MQHLIEGLENRQLLTASINLGTDGTLTIDNATNIQFNETEVVGEVQVADKSISETPVTYYEGVTAIVVNGTSGADILSGGTDTIPVTLNGGGGKDTINFANNGPVTSTIRDTFGKNRITVSNKGDGELDIFTTRSSSVTVAVGSSNINVIRMTAK